MKPPVDLVLAGPEHWAETWRPAVSWVAQANTQATRRAYTVALGQLTSLAPVALGDVQPEHAIAYKLALVDAGRAPATIRQRLSAVRALFDWAIEGGHHPGPNVSAYLAETGKRIPGSGRPLFQHLAGGPGLSTRQVGRIVASTAGRAGLGALRPHDLRRTFATRALSAGAPGPVVQAAMGHAHLETTARYYVPGFGGPRAADFLENGGE